ncbi:MAG: restriction endonuclease [Candidatus Nomurabacteria bacterium]|nr:restriction endonuclease [Candidatus Nomurabacteria bacterium]
MNLSLNKNLGNKYSNQSQKIRVITENWVLNQIYCPSCGGIITNYVNNKPVADFYCKKCVEDFELKSKKGKIGKTVPAGAYSKMIERINSSTKPNFFFMGYLGTLCVNNFFVIPKHFFISEIIEKRKPLSNNARRAGWVGSNIIFSKIPKAGQIFYIENGKEISKEEVLEKWQKTVFLKKIKRVDAKGWILDIMNCIDALNKNEFTLVDIYKFESELKNIHPENKHIKDKIRQQLQFLRDKNYIDFVGSGKYKLK